MIVDPIEFLVAQDSLRLPAPSFDFAESAERVRTLGDAVRSGSVGNNGVATIPSGWHSEFFGEVFVSPWPTLSLGVVADDAEGTFSIWSSIPSGSVIEALETDVDGLTMSLVTPKNIAPFKTQPTRWSISRSGDPAISGGIEITVDGKQLDLAVEGIRAVLWDLRPDWSAGARVQYDFVSDVFESWDGTEQIASVMDDPRCSMAYSYLLTDEQETWASNRLDTYQNSFLVPAWHEVFSLADGVGPSDRLVRIDRPLREVSQQYSVLLVGGSIHLIESCSADEIVFAKPAGRSYAVGTECHVAHACFLPDGASITRLTDRVATVSLTFAKQSEADGFITPEEQPQLWDLPLLEQRPNRLTDVTDELKSRLQVHDSGVGYRRVKPRTKLPERLHSAAFTLFGTEEIRSFIDFMLATRGQQQPFWMNSGNNDFHLATGTLEGATVLSMRNNGYASFKFTSQCYRQVAIHALGQVFYRKIVAAQIDSGDIERITIDEPLPAMGLLDVERISFVLPARWASDTFEFTFVTPDVAEISKGVKILDYEL
ncbi:hypothetical protein [Pseudomonas guariconensis]|uniref:hypothetical protein n=1 Tax=Pseudomonas guariconensis TaxID=1288410 RepID=UPI0018A898E2|nr:hypothetical protein [Pseudomonas guariconensis]MBF8755523.1 hypothetical protein [Pseudomonas guariconensis]